MFFWFLGNAGGGGGGEIRSTIVKYVILKQKENYTWPLQLSVIRFRFYTLHPPFSFDPSPPRPSPPR